MANIGTVTSSGKTVLALLDIDNQIKAGNQLGARSSVDWLRNEISKMKLGEANKKITKLNSDLSKAISEEKTAKEKLAAAKFDHLKSQTEQETAHNKALMDEQVTNLKAQTEVQMEAWKEKYTHKKQEAEDAFTKSELERIQQKIVEGKQLTQTEQQFIRTATPKAAGMDAAAFQAGIEDDENDTLLDQWMAPLVEKEKLGTLSAQENMRLFIMRMTRTGQIDQIDATTINRMFDETITEAQLEKFKAQAKFARDQRKDVTAQAQTAPPTGTAPPYASDLPGVPAQQTPAQTGPTAGSQLTPEQEAEIAAWKAAEDEVLQNIEDVELNRTPGGQNIYNKRQEAQQKVQEAAQNVFKSLPDGLAAVEYFRQQTAANPTDENRQLLGQVVRNFVNAPYLSSDYASAVSFLENKVAQATDAKDKKFWQNVLAQVSKEGVPKPTTSSTKGTPSKKGSISTLDKYGAEVGTWREARQKGTHKTGTPEEARSTYNANTIIASLGQTLPKSFTVNMGGFWWADKHEGGINWRDKKDALKMRQFTGRFLNQLTGDLRAKGYTPSDVQKIIEDIEGGVGVYGAAGQQVDTKSGTLTGVDALFTTFGNIMNNPATNRILTDFKKHLATYAKQQGVKEEAAADLSDEEKRLALWKGADGADFDAWTASIAKDVTPTKGGAPPVNTKPGSKPIKGKETRRWFNPKSKQFEEIEIDQVVRDAKGNIKEIVVEGKRQKVPGVMLSMDENVPLPLGARVFRNLPKGTSLIVDGQQYRFNRIFVTGRGDTKVEVTDKEGNITTFDYKKKFRFPNTMSTSNINRLLKGQRNTPKARPAGTKKPANPFQPNLTQPSNGAQKKNKGTVGSTAASMTWETLRDGRRIVKLDAEGRSFATILNLRKPGQAGRGLSGFYDADTGYGINVELPDWNKDGKPDDVLHLEGGATIALPDVWKSERYEKGDGAVYSERTTIRLAGFEAQEIYLTEADRKSGRKNPAAVKAQEALIQIFQQGWIDPSNKRRFIFKVRIAGTPNQHSAKYANPYRDKYDRIVTDVYIASGGVDKKIGEIMWVNPTGQLQQQGHGRPWQMR